MITGNYTLVANPEWRNVQSAEVFLQCDTTLADVNITLPALSALGGFWNVKINILNALGANKVNIIGFTQSTPTVVANKVNGVASVTLTTLGDSTVVSVEDANNWISTATTNVSIPVSVATLTKAALATATYTAKPVGTTLAVVDYATSGDGFTIVKTTLANNTFADWLIIATENATSTNHIGQTPK
jgi:hypothetical protein